MRLLLSGAPVAVVDVTTATGVDAAKLARVFVAEGVCAEVTDALATGYTGWVS